MMNKKDKVTINTNEFSNEPIMRAPPQELGNGQGAPPANDQISLAIKYVIEEQEQLYTNQEKINKELTNVQEHLDILLDRSKKNQDSLSKKNVSLKKLTSQDTPLADKEKLATAIITVHESDL